MVVEIPHFENSLRVTSYLLSVFWLEGFYNLMSNSYLMVSCFRLPAWQPGTGISQQLSLSERKLYIPTLIIQICTLIEIVPGHFAIVNSQPSTVNSKWISL